MNPVYTLKGVGGLLEVYEDKVSITPKSLLGFMNKGLKGTKTIPFSSRINAPVADSSRRAADFRP